MCASYFRLCPNCRIIYRILPPRVELGISIALGGSLLTLCEVPGAFSNSVDDFCYPHLLHHRICIQAQAQNHIKESVLYIFGVQLHLQDPHFEA